ncbi:dTMP kinase [Aquibacillus sp. 3ASR75-11]|uniref:Thymidylate kinase n=1 Tax=Terrihalobacillus insolitus TaxID=2950438 RepID=A0A9X4ANP8_9BACI|nr:dTMP kinase [Terrihalobacillus insolitus]MDC3414890.1 dTMP kinase [Terrihalobacillus insolitus]MDC3426039.1 dTMP kinase [Terrihalobacillus insolitus]
MSGYFITFEGGEGAGKTSILQAVESNLKQLGYQVVATREPGGIEIAEKIREIILDTSHTTMDSRTEALLYAAARRQHLVEKVLPSIKQNKIVLCDRFIDSSLAYQGFARGIGMENVRTINEFAIEGYYPDLTLFFDVPPKTGLQRITDNQDREQNRLDLEKLHFHEQVYQAYHMLLKKYPQRIHEINANQQINLVEKAAIQNIIDFLQNK